MTARRSLVSLLASLPAALAPATAAADDALVEAELLRDADGLLAVAHLENAFDEEIRGSVESGLPITLRTTTELWRVRRFRFDEAIASIVRYHRVRWDPGERRFRIEVGERRDWSESFATLDDALEELREFEVALAPNDALDPGSRYYLTVEAVVQRITLSEVNELDGWVRGRIGPGDSPPSDSAREEDSPRDDEDDGGGGLTGKFFGLLLRWTGFRDRVAKSRSEPARPAELPIREMRPAPREPLVGGQE
jgi:hypothetical protein